MKMKLLVTSLFSIVLFAGISNAQVKVITGSLQYHLLPASPTTSGQSTPNISVFAGQTIRLRIAVANNSEVVYVLMGTPPPSPGCDQTVSFGRPATGNLIFPNTNYIEPDDEFEALVPTESGWKGTCRVMSVRLRDGSEYLGRIYLR